MMKPFTCVCLLSAAGSLLYLYQAKHAAQVVDREVGGLIKQADQIREHTRLMQAQYQMLNDPERLAPLATQHLALQQLAPAQYVKLSDLGSRLPGPVAPAPEPAAVDDAPQTPALITAAIAAIPAPVLAPVVAPVVTTMVPVAATAPLSRATAIVTVPKPAPVVAAVGPRTLAAPAKMQVAAAPSVTLAAHQTLQHRDDLPFVPVASQGTRPATPSQTLQHRDDLPFVPVASQAARPVYPPQILNPPAQVASQATRTYNPPPYVSYPQPTYAQSGYPSAYAPHAPTVQNTSSDAPTASALGMGRTLLAPPVPVGAGPLYGR